ncbi:MAG: hypothetical protein ACRC8Y_26270, partial [Chroococcales cyanobacterium]
VRVGSSWRRSPRHTLIRRRSRLYLGWSNLFLRDMAIAMSPPTPSTQSFFLTWRSPRQEDPTLTLPLPRSGDRSKVRGPEVELKEDRVGPCYSENVSLIPVYQEKICWIC